MLQIFSWLADLSAINQTIPLLSVEVPSRKIESMSSWSFCSLLLDRNSSGFVQSPVYLLLITVTVVLVLVVVEV
ncbi:hypothetical protein EBX31_09585, partial [bacterium]|nr:hypothetical protein [bacterium]